MPITIKSNSLKFKNPDTGQYIGVDAVAETSTAEQIAAVEAAAASEIDAIEAKGDEIIDSLPQDYTDVLEDLDEIKSDFAKLDAGLNDAEDQLNPLVRMLKVQDYSYPASSSYSSDLTDFWLNVGESVKITVTEDSSATVFIDGYSSTSVSLTSAGDYTFTAANAGYLKLYHKKLVCTVTYSSYRVTSELGTSDYLLASQHLVNNVNTAIDKYIGYVPATSFAVGHYMTGTTVGNTVGLSAATDNWVYSLTPIFVKAGSVIHCTTRANGMCCIAKNSTNNFATAKVAVVADDNTNAKEYKYTALENGYYWFSGRVGETTAFADFGSTLMDIGGETYVVDVNGNGNFTSFTACLTALQNNDSPKTIYVREGVYDIYTELGGAEYIRTIDASTANWRDVQPVVPPNTKIVGIGNVTLSFQPEASEIGSNNMAFLFSPLNLSGSCEIENIELVGTNCRYALHQESSSLPEYDESVQKLTNVRMRKIAGTYGTQYVVATGIGRNNKWTYESCSFEGDLGIMYAVHVNVSGQKDMATIIMNNCTFVSSAASPSTLDIVRFTSSNNQSVERNIAKLNNCYLNGKLMLENSSTAQQWDITTIGCTIAGVDVSPTIVSNPYPVKQY